MMKPRKRSLLITALNLALIVLVVIFINHYMLSTKALKKGAFQYRFKFDHLKENMGYILSFSLENISGKEERVPWPLSVKFFIREKRSGDTVWEKQAEKQTFPIQVRITNRDRLVLDRGDRVDYIHLYEFQKEKYLGEAEYRLGAEAVNGSEKVLLDLPVSTKPKKGLEKIFK